MSAAETWALRLLLAVAWPACSVLIVGVVVAALVVVWVGVLFVEFEPKGNHQGLKQ